MANLDYKLCHTDIGFSLIFLHNHRSTDKLRQKRVTMLISVLFMTSKCVISSSLSDETK